MVGFLNLFVLIPKTPSDQEPQRIREMRANAQMSGEGKEPGETACYTYQLQTSPELAEEQESCSPEDRA